MAGSFLGRKDGRIFIKLRQGHQRHTKVLFVFLEFGIFPAGKILMDFKGWSFLWLKNSYFTFFIFIFWQGNDGFVRITLMFALTFNCTNVWCVSSTIERLSFFFSIQGISFSAWLISINSSVRTKTHDWSNLHFLITFIDNFFFFLKIFFNFGCFKNKNFKDFILSFIFRTDISFLHSFIVNRWLSKRSFFIHQLLFDFKDLLWNTQWILHLNFTRIIGESWVFSPCKFTVV